MYDKDGNELEGVVYNDVRAALTNFDSIASSEEGEASIRYKLDIQDKPIKDKKLEVVAYSYTSAPEKDGMIEINNNGDAKIVLLLPQNIIDHIKSCNKDASFTLDVYYNRKVGERGKISTDLTGYAITPHNELPTKTVRKTDYSAAYAIGIFLIVILFLINLYVLYQYIPQKPL